MKRFERPAATILTLLSLAFPLGPLELENAASAAELLIPIDLHEDGVGSSHSLSGVQGVAISADGRHVYTAASQDHALTAYLRDSQTGGLGPLEDFEDGTGAVFGLEGLSAVAVSTDGAFVYAVAEDDDTLALWSRDAEADALSFLPAEVKENGVGGVQGLNGAVDVTVSRDWQLFVASSVDDAIAVFSRGLGTSHNFIEVETDGAGAVDGLDGASAVAVSTDELHVYVTARIDDALTVFARSNRQLDFVATYREGTDGIQGLDGAIDVVVSPDNAHVYAVGEVEGEVAAFSRDPTTGELTFLDSYASSADPTEGLDGSGSIAISPGGRRVLVTSRKDNAVVVFRRDPETGELAPLETLRQGQDGVDGLLGAAQAVFSPNAEHVYIVSVDGNTLSSWALAPCLGDEQLGDTDGDGFCDDVDLCAGDDLDGDSDGDLVCDDIDACPGSPDQDDADGDLIPDACDLCRVNDAAGDSDGDGLCDDIDP